MKIVSWNANSIRIRINYIKKLTKEIQPDIICLQETKVTNDLFPIEDLKKIGYKYLYYNGEKSYNGVAIISKYPLFDINHLNLAASSSARHISGFLETGEEIHNFYVPAGGDEPDPKNNPKFDYKLRFYDDMVEWFSKNRKASDKIIMLGDLNTAPLEKDVWSHKQLLTVVSHTPIEVEKMNNLKSTLSWYDTAREFVDIEQKLFSWWSYRNKDWRKSNRGRRLDHIWITPSLRDKLNKTYIMKDARDWSNPSDHVPVVMDISL